MGWGEGEHRAPEPAPFKEGEEPPGQGGEIVQGRAQAEWGPAPSEEGGEEIPPPPAELGS